MIQRINHLNLEQEIGVKYDESKRRHDNNNIRFKSSMLRSSLCDYSDAYILVKRTGTVPNAAAVGGAVNNANKKVIFKSCAPFTDYITEMNNTQVDDAQKIEVLMSMYNLIEYSDAYLMTSGSLWQYYRDEPTLVLIFLLIKIIVMHSNLNNK